MKGLSGMEHTKFEGLVFDRLAKEGFRIVDKRIERVPGLGTFGTVRCHGGPEKDWGLAVGFRSADFKGTRFPEALVAGTNIYVCSNLQLRGPLTTHEMHRTDEHWGAKADAERLKQELEAGKDAKWTEESVEKIVAEFIRTLPRTLEAYGHEHARMKATKLASTCLVQRLQNGLMSPDEYLRYVSGAKDQPEPGTEYAFMQARTAVARETQPQWLVNQAMTQMDQMIYQTAYQNPYTNPYTFNMQMNVNMPQAHGATNGLTVPLTY